MSEQEKREGHHAEQDLGDDAYGIPYVRCSCGMKYPDTAEVCPVAPATEGSI